MNYSYVLMHVNIIYYTILLYIQYLEDFRKNRKSKNLQNRFDCN
jgi:hypothetical protein